MPEKIKNIFYSGIINDELNTISNGGEDLTINIDNFIFQITSSDNQKNSPNHNISTINLGECEEILKKAYKIKNKSLLILKIDMTVEGSKIPDIQYKVYHPVRHYPLNLSLCDGIKIEINIPVSIDEDKIYKYNLSSDYYNDKCFSYSSDNKTDMPLKYRREEFINNHMSLCESECDYLGYNNDTKNSKCECNVKKEMELFNFKINTDLLYEKFVNVPNINIDIIKCYDLIFKPEILKNNIGNYILLSIFILFITTIFIFVFKGYPAFNTTIDNLISLLNIKKISNNDNLITSASVKIINKKYKKKKKHKNSFPPIKKK